MERKEIAVIENVLAKTRAEASVLSARADKLEDLLKTLKRSVLPAPKPVPKGFIEVIDTRTGTRYVRRMRRFYRKPGPKKEK